MSGSRVRSPDVHAGPVRLRGSNVATWNLPYVVPLCAASGRGQRACADIRVPHHG